MSKRVEQNLEKNLYRAEEVPVHLREVYLPRDRSLGRRREVEPDVLRVEIGGGLGAFALADNPLLNLFGFFGLLGLIDAGLQGLWDGGQQWLLFQSHARRLQGALGLLESNLKLNIFLEMILLLLICLPV